MSEIGKIGNTEPNRITSIIPLQKTGAAKPTIDSTVMACESQPLGLRAASTPSAVPARKAHTTEHSTSSRVAGMRSPIRPETGRLKKYEYPRSSRATRARYTPSCTGKGWSSP